MSLANTSKNNQLNLPQIANPKHLVELSKNSPVEDVVVKLQTSPSQPAQTPPRTLHAARQEKLVLFQELETACQLLQYQQSLIESLTEQLTHSERFIVQLENELIQAQQRCEQQFQKLEEAETTCQDLRSQLYRQKNQTLQFKAALEKCVEASIASNQSNLDREFYVLVASEPVALQPSPAVSVTKTQPIQPWSEPQPLQPIHAGTIYKQQPTTKVETLATQTVPVKTNSPDADRSQVDHPSGSQIKHPNRLSSQIELPCFLRR